MNPTTYQTETVRLTPKEFEALERVDAQAYIDDYADGEAEAICHLDDITPERYAEEARKAKEFELTPTSFRFVRDSLAFYQSTYGLGTLLGSPFETTAAERRTLAGLIKKLKIERDSNG